MTACTINICGIRNINGSLIYLFAYPMVTYGMTMLRHVSMTMLLDGVVIAKSTRLRQGPGFKSRTAAFKWFLQSAKCLRHTGGGGGGGGKRVGDAAEG